MNKKKERIERMILLQVLNCNLNIWHKYNSKQIRLNDFYACSADIQCNTLDFVKSRWTDAKRNGSFSSETILMIKFVWF